MDARKTPLRFRPRTAELGTIQGLSALVFLSVVGLAWGVGRVEGRLFRVERSVERLQADMDGLRENVRNILVRLPAKADWVE